MCALSGRTHSGCLQEGRDQVPHARRNKAPSKPFVGSYRGCAASRPTGAMTTMNSVTIFWMQLITSVFVFGIVAVWYVWPSLTKVSRDSALTLLLFVHVPRYVGMTLLVTGMVDPKLPREFLSSAAYGISWQRRWRWLPSLLCGATGVLRSLWCGWPTHGVSWTC